MENINQQAKELIREHLTFWELAQVNYAALEKVQTRTLEVNGYPVILQFNPERIRSSAAKIDKQSLAARPCFLCEANRPGNQRWIDFGGEYQIMVNPYPIFREHLTIPIRAHQEQRLFSRYKDMLSLAEVLTDFIIFITVRNVEHQLPIICISRQVIEAFFRSRQIGGRPGKRWCFLPDRQLYLL